MEDIEKLEHVNFKQVVDAFVGEIEPAIKGNQWVDINFLFTDDGYALMDEIANDGEYRDHHLRQDVVDYIRALSGSVEDNIELLNSDTIKKNLELQNMSDDEIFGSLSDPLDDNDFTEDKSINIVVEDAEMFFEHLRNIINKTLDLYREYKKEDLKTWSIMQDLLANIWLRMRIDDVENPMSFLKNQLEFANNRKLDTINPIKISKFGEYDVIMYTKPNEYYDETSRTMFFKISKRDEEGKILEEYTLPKVLYDINDSDTCFICGVQNVKDKIDINEKKIKRELYKLNKGVENPDIHPSKVLSLMLFINYIKSKGITNVIVPSLQVLSYEYHEVLSRTSEAELQDANKEFDMYSESEIVNEKLKDAKKNYGRFYDKQDTISYLKTEELFNLVNRIVEHTPGMEITSEINLQGDSINIRL